MRRRVATWTLVGLLGVNGVLLLTESGSALPRGLGDYFFGPKLVRADVLVRDGGMHEFRLDKGRLLRRAGSSLMIREADGTVVVVRVAPDAAIVLRGKPATLPELQPGMTVTTIREGANPASEVLVGRK
jgi:hypothetical protein